MLRNRQWVLKYPRKHLKQKFFLEFITWCWCSSTMSWLPCFGSMDEWTFASGARVKEPWFPYFRSTGEGALLGARTRTRTCPAPLWAARAAQRRTKGPARFCICCLFSEPVWGGTRPVAEDKEAVASESPGEMFPSHSPVPRVLENCLSSLPQGD